MRPSGARFVMSWLALLPLLAGCASLGGRTPHVAEAADTIFYVSARARHDGRDTQRLAPALEYGMAVVHRHQRTPDEDIARDIADSSQLDSLAFVSAVQARLARQRPPFDFAVLYVHGMGTSLHEAWQHTAAARHYGGEQVPWIVFCWPSIGSGFAWPSNRAILTEAYHRDSIMADSARDRFAEALAVVRAAVPEAQLLLAAHSLGAQMVVETLHHHASARSTVLRSPLRALALLMPDIAAVRFRDSLAPSLSSLARRRVLYISNRDRALAVARMLSDSERAGLRRAGNWSPPNPSVMETVDVSMAATDEGWFQQHFGTHHAIKRQVGLLFDLVHIVGADRAAVCREQAGIASVDTLGVYQMRRRRADERAVHGCARFEPGSAR